MDTASETPARLYIVVLLGSFATMITGQSTGTISGFVTDQTGSVIPGAPITAILVEQNVSRSVEANTSGFYVFNALPPGTYSITAESVGFQRFVRSGMTLSVNQNLRVDARLRIGEVAEVIEVTGQSPLVDTTSGTISGLVDAQRIVDLPLNGRNIIGLARTVPGVQNVRAPQHLTDPAPVR